MLKDRIKVVKTYKINNNLMSKSSFFKIGYLDFMECKKRIDIIIADDHQIFLEGIVALISDIEDINIVGTGLDGYDVLSLLKNHDVDIVIMDINMPKMDGVELNGILKKEYPEIKTLVLSTYSYPDKISRFIKNRANGYLLKNTTKTELLDAIYSLANDNNYFSSEVKEKYMNSIFNLNNSSEITTELSEREKEVIKLITQEYTTQEIAEKLFISLHTVNTHRKNLFSKLHVKNIAGLVKYAIKNGMI